MKSMEKNNIIDNKR